MRKVIEVLRTTTLPEAILLLIEEFHGNILSLHRTLMYYKKKRVSGWITRKPQAHLPMHCIPWMTHNTIKLGEPGYGRSKANMLSLRSPDDSGITKGSNNDGRIYYSMVQRSIETLEEATFFTIYVPNTIEEYFGKRVARHSRLKGWSVDYTRYEIEYVT